MKEPSVTEIIDKFKARISTGEKYECKLEIEYIGTDKYLSLIFSDIASNIDFIYNERTEYHYITNLYRNDGELVKFVKLQHIHAAHIKNAVLKALTEMEMVGQLL